MIKKNRHKYSHLKWTRRICWVAESESKSSTSATMKKKKEKRLYPIDFSADFPFTALNEIIAAPNAISYNNNNKKTVSSAPNATRLEASLSVFTCRSLPLCQHVARTPKVSFGTCLSSSNHRTYFNVAVIFAFRATIVVIHWFRNY